MEPPPLAAGAQSGTTFWFYYLVYNQIIALLIDACFRNISETIGEMKGLEMV
jgi:hypothetical protein